jgi:hypothetical protein
MSAKPLRRSQRIRQGECGLNDEMENGSETD